MKYEEAIEEMELLLKTFAHYHVSRGKVGEDDSCKACGLDLRHPVHSDRYINPQCYKKGGDKE